MIGEVMRLRVPPPTIRVQSAIAPFQQVRLLLVYAIYGVQQPAFSLTFFRGDFWILLFFYRFLKKLTARYP